MNPIRSIPRLTALAGVLLLAACAGPGTRPDSDAGQAQLKQRAQARWELLINKHADQAYDFLTPGYRSTISRDKYASEMVNRPIKWESAKVNKVDCAQADSCTVYMVIGYSLKLPGMGGNAHSVAPIQESWLHLRNQWYYLPGQEGGNSLKTAK